MVSSDSPYLMGGGLKGCYRDHVSKDPDFFNLRTFHNVWQKVRFSNFGVCYCNRPVNFLKLESNQLFKF